MKTLKTNKVSTVMDRSSEASFIRLEAKDCLEGLETSDYAKLFAIICDSKHYF